MLKPPKLQASDKVAVVSLSWGGPDVFPYRYQIGKAQLQAALGVTVVEMPHALADPAWVARNPQARADDLMAAVADPTIKAIISLSGNVRGVAVTGRRSALPPLLCGAGRATLARRSARGPARRSSGAGKVC